MSRKEEIVNAARAYNSTIAITLANHTNVLHFEAGAKWADQHPNLESLWHDADEEPKEYPIIYQDEFFDVWILQFSLKDFVDGWKDFKGFECVTRWAYIKDLLPKGDKK